MGCCVCGADDFAEGWQRWDDHPAQRQWHVIKDLGVGAMSQVVLGQHRQTGEMAALKVVFLESPTVIDDPEHLALLQRESDLLSMLDHPNIVELKDVIRSPKQLVLVLEWLRGGQVIDRLHELGLQYSEQQAAAIFVQVAEAVAHMHEYRVLHRDIKPENVMFAEPPAEAKAAPLTAAQLQAGARAKKGGAGGGGGGKGELGPPPQKMPVVKLVDLGMACLYNPDKAVTGPLGSPGFVAPEIISGAPHAPSMDVFSLGVLLFIMLVGRKPFNIKESENLRYALASLQEAPGLKDPRWLDLSPDAKHLVMGMLAYDPARRLTMQQVLDHEWVVSRGGILPRPLGQDVVFGAATVASIRRLRNLCGGVVAFNRAAAAAGTVPAGKAGGGKAGSVSGSLKGGLPGDSAKDAYLKRLKQSQRLDPSARRGNAMHRFASNLASSAYARTHDAGGSVHPSADVSVRRGTAAAAGSALEGGSVGGRRFGALSWQRGSSQAALRGGSVRGGSLHGQQADPSGSRRNRFSSTLPGGMPRAGTTVMLSEMDRVSSRPMSRKGSGRSPFPDPWAPSPLQQQQDEENGGGGGLQRRPSTLKLLTAAAKLYLEGSTHGSRRGPSAASPFAAVAGSSGSAGSSALRQVADDSSLSRSQKQQEGGAGAFQEQLAAIADGSSSHSGSSAVGNGSRHSSSREDDGEGRRRGTAAGAVAVGATPRPGLTASSGGSAGILASPVGGSSGGPRAAFGGGSGAARSPLAGGSGSGGVAVQPPGFITAVVPPLPISSATTEAAALAATGQGPANGVSTSGPRSSFQAPRGSFQAPSTTTAAFPPPPSSTADGSSSGSRSKGEAAKLLDGLRPHVVVKRQSLDNPLAPRAVSPPPPQGRSWADVQAQLRQQTPRSSREGSRASSTPGTRVVRIKPLE